MSRTPTPIGHAAIAAREAARQRTGEFGVQGHSAPNGTLLGDAALTGTLETTAAQQQLADRLVEVAPDATRAVYELVPHPFDPGRVLVVPEQIDHEDGEQTVGVWNRQLASTLPTDWEPGVESPLEAEVRESFDPQARPERFVLERAGDRWLPSYL